MCPASAEKAFDASESMYDKNHLCLDKGDFFVYNCVRNSYYYGGINDLIRK